MAYKNSAGASSAKQEFYNWSYFSQDMTKLGEAKGVQVNIKDRLKPPQEEVDWLSTVAEGFKKLGTVADAYKEKAFKQADEYLRTHSLEEYQEDVKNNNIPFQYDPVSMSRLKYQHGKLAFSLAEQDFQDRVNRNEFNGKSPEEVDAEYFKHVRKAMEDVRDSFGYDINEDSWFSKGFYADSPESRQKILLQNIQSNNKWSVEQAKLVDLADVRGAVNDLSKNAAYVVGTILDVFDGEKNPKLAHYSPADKADMVSGLLEDVAGREDGVYILQQLENWKPYFLDGKLTVRDMVGAVAWDKALKTASNAAWKADAERWTSQALKVDNWVANGDTGSIEQELALAKDRAGGVVSAEVEYLTRSLQSARDQQRALIAKNTANSIDALKEEGRSLNANYYIESMLRGLPTNPENVVGTTKEHIDREFMFAVQDGRITENDILEMACNPTGGYNPASSYLSKVGNNVVRAIKADILSLENSNAASIEKPAYLDKMYSFYVSNPKQFATAFGGMGSYDMDVLLAMMNANQLGMTYNQCVSALKQQKKLGETREGRQEQQRIYDNLAKDAKGDLYSQSYMVNRTYAYMNVGMSRKDAMDRSREDLDKETISIDDSRIPAKLFMIKGVRPEATRDWFEEEVTNKIKTLKKDAKEGVIKGYNPMTDSFEVVDADTRSLLARWDRKSIHEGFMKYIDEQSRTKVEPLGVVDKLVRKTVHNVKGYTEYLNKED